MFGLDFAEDSAVAATAAHASEGLQFLHGGTRRTLS